MHDFPMVLVGSKAGESVQESGEYEDDFEREFMAASRTLTSDLYHYTTSEAAILGILANRTIRMSPFDGTNDLWESRPLRPHLEGDMPDGLPNAEETFGIWEDVDRYIRGYSKVACFTQDWELPDAVLNRDAYRGWSHLSLWAHYGANHAGICLRFDRGRLLSAFEAAGAGAVHQFHGPVDYRYSEFGIGPHGIKLEQVAEFGVDAVALHYARTHRDRVFFRKHADWSTESEFRLVRTDLTVEPHYVDVSKALTGVVIGESFPTGQLPALFRMISDFDSVCVQRANFQNRVFQLFPVERADLESVVGAQMVPAVLATKPRRPGNLLGRLRSLEIEERTAAVDRSQATRVADPILAMWEEEILRQVVLLADWPEVVLRFHPGAGAIPEGCRGKPAGVPGETFAVERGVMLVAEHQPQYSFTFVVEIALQLTANGNGRLHASISSEEWMNDGNERREYYRDRRDVEPGGVEEASSEFINELLSAVPKARLNFDLLRYSAPS